MAFGRISDEVVCQTYTATTAAPVPARIRSDQQVDIVEERLEAFEILCLEGLDDFRRAAGLYRTARRHGVTVRRTLDCLIASVCVREGIPILHNDADLDRLAEHTDLQIHRC